jgi:hypothetical protein
MINHATHNFEICIQSNWVQAMITLITFFRSFLRVSVQWLNWWTWIWVCNFYTCWYHLIDTALHSWWTESPCLWMALYRDHPNCRISFQLPLFCRCIVYTHTWECKTITIFINFLHDNKESVFLRNKWYFYECVYFLWECC